MTKIYTIKLSKQVKKFLQNHPKIMKRFFDKIQKLTKDPFDTSLDTKNFRGKENCYRLRIGKYRFLYEIEEKIISIYFFKADSRGDVYKQ